MKKKIFTVLLCLFSLLSVVSAQKSVAFKHLGIGVEFFSTTGFGLELATPLSPNFALRGGVSMFPVSISSAFDVDLDESILAEIDRAINADDRIKPVLVEKGLPTAASDISREINAKASLGLINGKVLFDYYPLAKKSFHFTAGVYIAPSELVKAKGSMDEAIEILNVLKDNGYNLFNNKYIVDEEKGYELTGYDLIDVRGALKINSVKPYFGLGFGRAVPKRKVGVTFEIGAMYHGTPKITSKNPNVQKMIDNELLDNPDILKEFYLSIYPVLSLKLNFKAF